LPVKNYLLKKILLFGAGKSATVLIDYLLRQAPLNDFCLVIADADEALILSKTNYSPLAIAVKLDITDTVKRTELISQASIVISMMPPALHFLIAQDCVNHGKNLLTASYLDNAIKSLEPEINSKQLLFIGEMGLDPGIDHMSAMQLIDTITSEGGTITSFISHCGGLVAPESDDNPWHYKISWNPRNIVMAGKAGAEYQIENKVVKMEYASLFEQCDEVAIPGVGKLAFYPNRDSLSYMPLYNLQEVATFLRTTLRHPSFCKGWQAIVGAGLTDESISPAIHQLTFKEWSVPVLPFVTKENHHLLKFLGLFDDTPVPEWANSSAVVLQYLMEDKLAMQPGDKDMIVMLHQVGYTKNGVAQSVESSLVVKGKNHIRTAMAATVGLPLGIAAKLILNGSIQLTGLHLPVKKEIYVPVLKELAEEEIVFKEVHSIT